MNYRDLDKQVQEEIQVELARYWNGLRFEIDEHDSYYGQSGMHYGYIAIQPKTREILLCDATPDDGDTLFKILRF